MLFNRPLFGEEDPGKVQKKDRNQRERETYRKKLYWTEDLGLHQPSEAIHHAMQEGANYGSLKVGRKGLGKKIKAGLIPTDFILLDGEGRRIEHDDEERIIPFPNIVNGDPSGRVPKKILRVRPMLLVPWTAWFDLHVFDGEITEDLLESSIALAGQFNGMGDWRPKYGKFILMSLEEVKDVKAA
jgi:hypothetical protein